MLKRLVAAAAAVSLAGLILVVVTPSMPAQASYQSGGHYYAAAEWPSLPAGTSGAAAALYTQALYSTGSCVFVTNELWVNEDQTGRYWVEQGQADGYTPSGCNYDNPYWFWADNRPCCGYFEHDEGTAILDEYYGDWIWQTGPNQYTLQFGPVNGSYIQSTSGLGGGDEGAPVAFVAGSEASNSGAIGSLDAYDYLYYLQSTWNYGWVNAVLTPNGSPSCIYWATQWTETALGAC